MSKLDQTAPSYPEAEESILSLADAALGKSLEAGNFDTAAETLRQYGSIERASALGASKLLHGVNQFWTQVRHEEGDSVAEWAQRERGYHPLTTQNHIGVWELLSNHYIPKEFRSKFFGQTMRQLVKEYRLFATLKPSKLGNFDIVEMDYEINHEDMIALSESFDEATTAAIVAEIKGKPRNKNLISLKIDPRGDVYAHRNSDKAFLFHLPIDDYRDFVQQSIDRVLHGAGITPYTEA